MCSCRLIDTGRLTLPGDCGSFVEIYMCKRDFEVEHNMYKIIGGAVIGMVVAFFMPTMKLADLSLQMQSVGSEQRMLSQRVELLLGELRAKIDDLNKRLDKLEDKGRKMQNLPGESTQLKTSQKDDGDKTIINTPYPPNPKDPPTTITANT